MANGPRIGIVLGGTAPAMTLMSGAMLAFDERNVEFDVISTTGVGGLIGMLYLAPKGGKRKEALLELPNLFVSDWLYRLVPVNFKVFYKYGPFATKFYELRKALPKFTIAPDDPNPLKRFVNDWMELWATALTPPGYEVASKGFMSHVPLVDDLVDFGKLRALKTATPKRMFYLNAFSLWKRRLQIFDNDTVNTDVYNAAQAMFMLFPPVRLAGDLLTTGATRDPTGLQAIWTHERDLDAVLALDPVNDCAWREPANAYDAFQLMLLNPVAALQQLMFTWYASWDAAVSAAGSGARAQFRIPPLYRIPVTIDDSYYPTMLEWTHANALKLQKIGYDAAAAIAGAVKALDRTALESYRFANFLKAQARPAQFLMMFKPTFEQAARVMDASVGGARPESGKEAR